MTIQGTNASAGYRTGVSETEFRVRLLTGRWYDDVKAEMRRQLGTLRTDIVGPCDIAQNSTLDAVREVGVAYWPPPLVTGMDLAMSTLIGDYSGDVARAAYEARGGLPLPSTLAASLAWNMHLWLACNESGVIVAWGKRRPIIHVVPSSDLRGIDDPEDPGQPVILGWKRTRVIGEQSVELWDVWDLRGEPSWGIYAVASWEDGKLPRRMTDKTAEVIGSGRLAGDAYPWRWTQGERRGEPFIPARIYHRQQRGILFDRDSGSELAQGTLNTAVYWSYWGHLVKDVCHSQRYVVNLEVAGTGGDTRLGADANPGQIPTDPATVLHLAPVEVAVPYVVDQWDPAADPNTVQAAVNAYQQNLTKVLIPLDYSSTGGDPLAQRQQAVSRAVSSLYPTCREHDGALLEIIAAVANAQTGSAYPESGYGLLYREEIERAQPPAAPAPPPSEEPVETPDEEEPTGETDDTPTPDDED